MIGTSNEFEVLGSKKKGIPVCRFFERWIMSYLFLYIIPFPIGTVPWTGAISEVFENSKQAIVSWIASELFSTTLTTMPNGSGDTTYNYFEVAFMLSLAFITSVVASFLPEKLLVSLRGNSVLRIGLRYYLATTMLGYGWHKLFPIQFPAFGPDTALSTYGDSSPMGLLWRFMGASTAYQMFAGLAEVLAGLLLLVRRTALLGALLCGGVLANVVLLNFCFDVPVKIYSSHLLLMAVCIIYPDTGRLVSFFLLSREEDSLHERSQRRRSIGQQLFVTLLKMAMCAVIALLPAVQNWQYMVSDGIWKSTSARHGIYRVDTFERAGVLGKDNEDSLRWVRVGLNDNGILAIQYANGHSERYRLEIDEKQMTVPPDHTHE